MNIDKSRRRFLRSSLASSALISLSGHAPEFLVNASMRAEQNDDQVLVVLQLSGGNDGLNTVIPYGDDEYYKNRFTLAIGKNRVHRIDDYVGFHPALRGLSQLYEGGRLSVVQGVGYPNPNRSHFESMDLWHTAHQTQANEMFGWLGQIVESQLSKEDLPALHLGGGVQPLALKTVTRPVPSIRSIDNFKLSVLQDKKDKRALVELVKAKRSNSDSLLAYVQDSANVALKTSHRLERVQSKRADEFGYPGTTLGRNLGVIANLIESGLGTRIYYVTLEGFDTHSNQAASHESLLTEFGNCVQAFAKQMEKQGNQDRVCLMAFSEFGRRVRENASRGTDHGTAAPLFVWGGGVKGGLAGKYPSLTDLDEGDLKYTVDYRRVYRDVLSNGLGLNADTIIDKSHAPLGLFG